MSLLFPSGEGSIGASASASVFPMNIQGWFPLGLTGFDLLTVQGTLKSLLQHHSSKASILQHSAVFMVQLSHPCLTTGKTIVLTICSFLSTMWYLCFLYAILVHLSFPSKEQVSFNFLAGVTICSDFGAQEIKVCHWFHCFLMWVVLM